MEPKTHTNPPAEATEDELEAEFLHQMEVDLKNIPSTRLRQYEDGNRLLGEEHQQTTVTVSSNRCEVVSTITSHSGTTSTTIRNDSKISRSSNNNLSVVNHDSLSQVTPCITSNERKAPPKMLGTSTESYSSKSSTKEITSTHT